MTLRIDTQPSDIASRFGEIGKNSADEGARPVESESRVGTTSQLQDARGETQDTAVPARAQSPEDGAIHRQQLLSRMHTDARAAAPQPAPARAEAAVTQSTSTPMVWSDYSVYVTNNAAQRQGSLDVAQSRLHGEISGLLMRAAPSSASGVLTLAPSGLGTLASLAGAPGTALSANHLDGATRYINSAANAPQQQQRIAQSLGTLAALASPRPPQLSAQEMKDQLWMALKIPEKAFKKMNEAEIRAKYDQLMGALSGPAGSHSDKIGKYKVSFTVDGNGNVTDCKVKKKGWFSNLFSGIGNFFGKFGKAILGVCSFIPIPWIAIPARIISGVIAVVEGIKNKNLLQAVIGVAGAVAGGAGAIAGKAVTGVAAGVASVATTVGKVARGVQASVAAIKSGNVLGVVSAAASLGGSIAGAVGKGAEAIANVANKVGEWSNRVLVGEQVYVSVKDGKFIQAVDKAAGLVADVAGSIKGGANVAAIAGQVQTYTGYADDAIGVVGDLRNGDIAGALNNGANLYTSLDTAFGAGTADDRDVREGNVAQYLHYAASAVDIGTRIQSRDYVAAFEQASTLFNTVATQEFDGKGFDPNSGWATSVHRWLDNGAKVVGIVDDIRAGRIDKVFDSAPGVINDIAWDFSHTGLVQAPASDVTRDTWQVKQQIDLWSGRGEDAWRIASGVRNGHYVDAAHQAVTLGADIAGNADAGWAASAHRMIDYATQAVQIGVDLDKARIDAALDRAAVLAGQIADAPAGHGGIPVLQDISVWMGRGADAWRITRNISAGDYQAAALNGLELGIDLGGGNQADWGKDARKHGERLIDTGFDLGHALDSRDVMDILRTADAFGDALREAAQRARHQELPQALAA